MVRILCLHGSGASAAIMKSQIANIRSLLPSSYIFDFLDAPIECEPANELKDVYSGPYYCFFKEFSDEEMQNAINFVQEVVEEDGPYDCVMGFSQGASVAAAYIAHRKLTGSLEEDSFKAAVFLCAALVPPKSVAEGNITNMTGVSELINMPTVHIIGRKDLCQDQSLALVKCCTQNMAQVLLNDSGHDVPRDIVNSKNIAHAIERALRLAFSG